MKRVKTLVGIFALLLGFSSQLFAKQKVLIVVTNNQYVQVNIAGKDTVVAGGYELSEVSEAYNIFTESGFRVDFMSPKGGKTFYEPEEDMKEVNKEFIAKTDVMEQLENSLSPSQVNANDYAAIYFAGGKTMWDFPESKELGQLAVSIYEAKGIVGAVCHGPAALVNAKLSDGTYLVAGKKVSSFTDREEQLFSKAAKLLPFYLQEKLTSLGVHFQEAPPLFNQTVVDGRLVTGQNPLSTYSVANEMVKLMGKKAVERSWTDMSYTLEVIKLLVLKDKNEAESFTKAHAQAYQLKQQLFQDYSSYAFAGHLGEVAKNKALALLEFAAEVFPESAKSQEALAQAYHSLGKEKLALIYLKKSIELEPGNPSALKLKQKLRDNK
ncbi:MAG: DJ-1/PfpI family protein [Bacteroidota bacterium]